MCNSKRYEQPGEVELAATISLETARKKNTWTNVEDVFMRQRLADENS